MKKIKQNLGMLLLLITIVTFNVIIGANEKGLRIMPISVLMALTIIYLIVIKIKNKKERIVFKNKVDYLVLDFMIITTLPLVFGTWASYSDTVEFMMKYFFIYSVYVLARNVIKEKKHIEYIIVTTLVCSLFSIALRFDYLNGQILKDFIKWLDLVYDKGSVFTGMFGYANAQAIYMAFCIFLSMHRFKINKSRILKIIDILYILFALYIIYITEARAVLILLVITLFILFVIKYRKQILKHKIKICVILTIILTVYLSIALKVSKPIIKRDSNLTQIIKYDFKQNQKYTVEVELETQYLGDIEDYRDKSFIVSIYQCGKYFIDTKIKYEFIGDYEGKYKIEFTPTEDTDSIRIKVKNLYKGIVLLNKCYINGQEQILKYKYIPTDLGRVLSGSSINGKSIPQRIYMYQDCLEMAEDSPIFGNGGNVWKNVSRAVEDYRGALKESHSYFFELLISYGIVGLVAFYTLVIYFFIKIFKQCKKDKNVRKQKLFIALGLMLLLLHSIIDFDMSFMLIQLIVYIYMAVLLYDDKTKIDNNNISNKGQLKANNKNINDKKIHNEIEEKNDCKIKSIKISKLKDSCKEYIVILFLIFILSLYIRADISKYLLTDNSAKHSVASYKKTYYNEKIKDDIVNNENGIEILEELKDYMKKELYHTQNENYEMYFDLLYKNIDSPSNEQLKDYLNFGIERVKKVREKMPMYFETVIKRAEILTNTINNLKGYIAEINVTINSNKEISTKQQSDKTEKIMNTNNVSNKSERITILNSAIDEIKEIIKSEYDKNIKNIEEYYRNGYSKSSRDNMKKEYEDIIDLLK